MTTLLAPERLNGKFDGTTPPAMLPVGGISGGGNVRKVSETGGWKPRKGCALHNTTALQSGAAVKSLHYYQNPFSLDGHFLAQCNSKLLYESAQNKLPPTQDTSFGTDLGVTVGTTPGFSDSVGEWWFYADGSGRPTAWGGTAPRPRGFTIWNNTAARYSDYSRKVADGRADTYGVITGGASDAFFVYSEGPLSGVTLTLGSSVNANSVSLTISALRSGSYAAVSGLSDGTASSGKTLAQSGTVSWTANAADSMLSDQGMQGYVYKGTWSGALSGSVYVTSITVVQAAASMTNKWNGEWSYLSGCRFYNSVTGQYNENLGAVSNESVSMYIQLGGSVTADFLYIKTPEPAAGFGFGIASGYGNTAAYAISKLEFWDGSAWATQSSGNVDTTKDSGGTKSFAQSGTYFHYAQSITPQMFKLNANETPGYWYRLSWAGTLSADVRVFAIYYASYPDVLPAYKGCVNFKNRLFVWGDPEYPNRFRYSAQEDPFCFSGGDSGYTDAFGAKDPILYAVPYYNELIVYKKHGVWLLEGEGPATFGTLKITDKIGLASPKSVQVAEVGFPAMHRDEPLTIAAWQDDDGVYVFDGRKTKKVSLEVDNYFNPELAACIPAANITSLQSYNDPINNEYHLLLPTVELVYNYVTAEWYPPYTRAIPLACGLDFSASDNRDYCYGGSASGFIIRLETDTTDKDTSNTHIAIAHSVKTRAVAYEKTERMVRFTLRRILAEFKAQAAGNPVCKTFKDLATSGTTQAIPAIMSMVNTGYTVIVSHVEVEVQDCRCVEFEFSLNVADQEMEIYSFYYEIAGAGISEK